jgi:hypothetical protein
MSRIADLLRYRGQAEADAIRQQGAISANMGASIGGIVGQAAGQIAEHTSPEAKAKRADAARTARTSEQIREALKLTRDPETGKLDMQAAAREVTAIDPVEGLKWWTMADAETKAQVAADMKKVEGIARSAMFLLSAPEPERPRLYAQMRAEFAQKHGIAPDALPAQYDENFIRKTLYETLPFAEAIEQMGKAAKDVADGKFRVFVKGPNGEKVEKLVTPEDLMNGIEVWTEPKPVSLQSKEMLVNGKLAAVNYNPSTGQYTDAAGQPVNAQPVPPSTPAEPTTRFTPRPVIDDSGNAVEANYDPRTGKYYAPDGTIIKNPKPASSREQGRPVTSGDAGRITDFDTSLDDLKVLRETLTSTAAATGTAAKVGALLPNPVTELTGWGEDAKKRQGVIDRVKQVIGKALEGGVLRKEDESKYEKILPTLADTQQVAMAKLNDLERAIKLRRERMLESLSDAGFDTSRFSARPNALTGRPDVNVAGGPPPIDDAGRTFSVRAPDGKTYTFKSQQDLDAFKKAAGIK